MFCEFGGMQISSASLLAAQQARTQQAAAQPRAAASQTAMPEDSFEPLLFSAKPDAVPAKPAVPNAAPQATYMRPGSQIDIKV
jgi:hypothetical protein